MKYYISPRPTNPLARILAALVGAVCLVGAFFFGLAILAVVAVLIAVSGLVFWLRGWWLGRKGGSGPAWTGGVQPGVGQPGNNSRPADFIEAEYTVVSERRD